MSHNGIGTILVSSRSFDEYTAMFALTGRDLAGTILDCPAGAASFTAGAHRRGIRATACDPAYTDMPNTLANARAEVERGHRYVLAHGDEFRGGFFRDPDHHLQHRLAAADAFVADATVRPRSYVAAALPHLPFPDRTFDLVLSSHLLFSYGDRLDHDTHLAYLSELVRVARSEVRVFPLVSHDTHLRSPHLATLQRALSTRGVSCEQVAVDYDYEAGAHEMLVCRRV